MDGHVPTGQRPAELPGLLLDEILAMWFHNERATPFCGTLIDARDVNRLAEVTEPAAAGNPRRLTDCASGRRGRRFKSWHLHP